MGGKLNTFDVGFVVRVINRTQKISAFRQSRELFAPQLGGLINFFIMVILQKVLRLSQSSLL